MNKANPLGAYALEINESHPELAPLWCLELVRSFGGSRGLTGEDDQLRDLFEEALVAAMTALRQADRKRIANTEERTAFVKRAVTSRLTDINRVSDRRQQLVPMDFAEALRRDEDDDGSQRLIEERFDTSLWSRAALFSQKQKRRVSSFDLALKLTLLHRPDFARYWKLFRETSGSDRAIAAMLGLDHKTVRDRLRVPFCQRFAAAMSWIEDVRND